MLKDYPIAPVFPVADMERAKDFYQNKLGLSLKDESVPGFTLYEAGHGTMLAVYEKKDHVQADFTQAGFNVTDLEGLLKELAEKGVKPEQYDMPEFGMKTDENGIVTMGNNEQSSSSSMQSFSSSKSAWIKDPDGNVIALNQM
jgi:predicted enzyme related to lactoylglutathione lyase